MKLFWSVSIHYLCMGGSSWGWHCIPGKWWMFYWSTMNIEMAYYFVQNFLNMCCLSVGILLYTLIWSETLP